MTRAESIVRKARDLMPDDDLARAALDAALAMMQKDREFIEAADSVCDYLDKFGAWYLLSTLGVSEALRRAYRARRAERESTNKGGA